MAKLELPAGTTSKLIRVFALDTTSTTGAGKTGIAFGSVTGYYVREGAGSTVAISMASAALGTFTSGGWVEIDSTHMAGWYEVGIPNLAIAASAQSVAVHFTASGMAPIPIEIELTANSNQDASAGGMSKIATLSFDPSNAVLADVGYICTQAVTCPNPVLILAYVGASAAPGQAGGLPLLASNGTVQSDAAAAIAAKVPTALTYTGGVPIVNANNTAFGVSGDFSATMKTSGATFSQTGAAAAITAAGLPSKAAMQQALTAEDKFTTGTVWHLSPEGSNSNSGLTVAASFVDWNTLAGTLVDGDAIRLGPGLYSTLDPLSFGTDLEIIGSGMAATTIFNPNFSTVGQMIGSTGSGGANYFKCSDINAGSAVVTTGIPTIELRRVQAIGEIDGLAIFDESLVSVVLAEDCIFGSTFDSCNIVGVISSTFRRCSFLSIGNGANIARGVVNQSTLSDPGGPMLLIDCDIVATNANNNCAGVVVSGATGVAPITLVNCRIIVEHSGTGTVYSLDAGVSGTITCYGCTFDRSLTNGTVVDLPLSAMPANLTQWLGSAPGAAPAAALIAGQPFKATDGSGAALATASATTSIYNIVNSGTYGNQSIKTALGGLITTVGVAGAGLTAIPGGGGGATVVANVSLTPAQAILASNQVGGSLIQAYKGYALINYNQSFNNLDGTPANWLDGLGGTFKVFTPGTEANLFTPITFTFVKNVAQFTVRAANNSALGQFRYEISYTDSGTSDPVLIATNSYTISDGGTAP